MSDHYPSFDEVLDAPDPERVFEVHRSLRSIISHFLLFLISVVVVYVINVAFAELPSVVRLVLMSPRWLAIIPAALLLNIIRIHHDDLYIFSLKGVTHYEGRLSLSSSVPYVKYADIRSLRVRQGVWGRVFGYGDLDLDTAANNDVELSISGIIAPQELQELIEELRHHNLTTLLEKEKSQETAKNE